MAGYTLLDRTHNQQRRQELNSYNFNDKIE